MENAGVQKKQSEANASVFNTVWDPFWFVRQVLGWGRFGETPSFDVKETDDTYVCKIKVKLTLPDRADTAHVKAELDDSELTLLVPKAAALTPKPDREPVSPQPKARRATGPNRRGSAGRKRRRGARTRARRG